MGERHGEAQGTRQFLDLLRLHRRYPAPVVCTGVEQALALGLTDAGSVATLVRGAQQEREPVERDITLGTLVRYGQACAPSLTHYDARYLSAQVHP